MMNIGPDPLDLPEALEPVGGVGLPAGPQRLLDLCRQVAVKGQLPHHDRKVAVRDDFRLLLIMYRYYLPGYPADCVDKGPFEMRKEDILHN